MHSIKGHTGMPYVHLFIVMPNYWTSINEYCACKPGSC